MAALANDWANLARLVRERREQLGLTQADVEVAGGPSHAVVRRIENEQAEKYQPKTLRALEAALRLRPGSVRAALEGGRFTPADGSRSSDSVIHQIQSIDGLDEAD